MIGLFPSIKLGRMVAFESLIEQDYLYILDYEADVVAFEEQPLTIPYAWQEKQREYTPDFLVRRQTGCQLVECKPTALVSSEDNQRKFAIAREWCKSKEWSFAVVTDRELRNGVRLANIKLLTQYARLAIVPETIHWVHSRLANAHSPLSLREGGQLLYPNHPAQGISILLYLAFHHQVAISLENQPISGASLIQIPESTLR